MTDRELVAFVYRVGTALGWRIRRMMPQAAGEPVELVLVRRTRRVLAVVTTDVSAVSLGQRATIDAWGAEAGVWTPRHVEAIRELLG
jgi:hypothetical protein